MTVRWGILSTARINDRFLEGLRESVSSEPLAVASRDLARARAYADARGIKRAYGSYDDLLEDDDVEAVYVSLPNSQHVFWARRALEAGKHVLCEKPLSRHVAEVESAFNLAERQNRLLMEAFMYRHNPQTRRLSELVSAGAIGRLRLIRSAFSFRLDDRGDVRLSRELDGGALMDVGSYCVNVARLLAGEPEVASGAQVIGGDGVDITFVGALRFPHSVLAHFDAGLMLAARGDLEVVGEEATLTVADPWFCFGPGIEIHRGGETERVEVPRANSYALEADNLAAAIRGEAEPLLGRADAVGQARAIETLYASADAGAPRGM